MDVLISDWCKLGCWLRGVEHASKHHAILARLVNGLPNPPRLHPLVSSARFPHSATDVPQACTIPVSPLDARAPFVDTKLVAGTRLGLVPHPVYQCSYIFFNNFRVSPAPVLIISLTSSHLVACTFLCHVRLFV